MVVEIKDENLAEEVRRARGDRSVTETMNNVLREEAARLFGERTECAARDEAAEPKEKR